MAKRNHLDDSTCGRMIGKLEERRTLSSKAEEFGISKSFVPRAWKAFQTTGTVEMLSKPPPTFLPMLERLAVAVPGKQLQWMTDISSCRRKEPEASQQAPLLSNCLQQLGGKCHDTMARRLHKGGLLALRREHCILLTVG